LIVAEEMVVRLRATAEGVKQGVAAAKGSLQELQREREKLKTELQLKINSEEIKKLKTEMSELEKQKKELEQTVRFKVESDSTVQLRMELQEIEEQMGLLQESIDLHMTLKDDTNARGELDWLASEKERLEGEINLSISTHNEDTKKKLLETEKQIADINREIQIKIDESGANELSSKLKAVDEDIKNVKASSMEMEKSFNQASIAAGAAFAAILVGAKKGLDAFNQYTSTMNGLSSQMEHLGVNIVDAMSAVQEISADGLITPADAAASIKNLTSYGYALEEAKRYTQALADTAVYNKQAHYSVSEAVRVTTEGIKNENSVLSDAAGMTKNISVMYKEYAESIGKTVNELTQAEKAQATYNIGMADMAAYTGNAAEYLKTLGGAQDTLRASTSKLAKAYGEALAPSVQEGTEALTTIVQAMTGFISKEKGIVVGTTAIVAGFSGIVVALKAASVATKAFSAELAVLNAHPIIAVLTVSAGALIALGTEIAEVAKKQKDLNAEALTFKNIMGENASEDNITDLNEFGSQLNTLKDDLIKAQEEYKNWNAALEKGSAKYDGDLDIMEEFITKNEELINVLNELGYSFEFSNADLEGRGTLMEALNKIIEENKNKILEKKKAQEEAQRVANLETTTIKTARKSLEDYASELNKLSSAYETLSRKEDLSVSQLTELIQLYPSVAKEIAENGIQRERLAEIINIEMKASREAAIQELADRKASLETERDRIKAFIKGYQDEANAHNTALAEEKQGLADFVNAALKAKEDIENNRLSTVSVEKVATTGMQTLIDLVAQYDKDIGNLEDRMNALRNTPLYDSSKATKKEKETTTELEKQLQLLEDQKAIKEMSIEEEVAQLKEINRLYAKTDAEKLEMKKRLYAKEKDLADKHYAKEIEDIEKLNKGRVDNTDFSALIEKYKALGEKIKVAYADYPETMKEMLEEVNDIIIGLTEKKADKIAGIERDNINEIISLYDDYIGTMKKLDGLSYGFDDKGEPLIFKFDAAKEKAAAEKVLQAIDATLDNFISIYGDKTENMGTEEKALYEYLLQQKKIFVDKMKDLTIEEIADRQKLYEKENEDRLKAMEKIEAEILALQKEKIKEAISAEKERTKGLIDEVKKRYDEEIKAAEAAADAEIAIYEDKIKAIDALLKAEERQEADEDYQDKINRLKETLKFETDDSNKYELQKEIANLTAENEKRKRKESLEDEKESYREKIDLAKNNLSEQKEALQEKRDAEIAMHEEALESYTKKLEEELSALEKNNKKSIDDLKQTLATQKRDYAAFLKQKEDDTKANNTEIEKLMNQSTTNILDKLKERVSEFADAGASAGAAWRNAFNEMVADIMSSTDSYSANVASAQAATMTQSPSITNNNVQLYQSNNMPTASPAKVARESKKALQDALKYV